MSKSKPGRSKIRQIIPIPLPTLIMPDQTHVNNNSNEIIENLTFIDVDA
jgi:hypothetical protein